MENNLIFGYWTCGGIGEPIRWLLHYLEQEFTNVKPTHETWPQKKSQLEENGLKFPNLPFLIDGEWKITESRAIPYYLVNRFQRPDLYGNNWKEMSRLKEIEGVIRDIHKEVDKVVFTPEYKTKIAEAVKKESVIYVKLNYLSKFLGKKEFFLGHLTYVDMNFAYFLRMFENFFSGAGFTDFFSQFENFNGLRKRIVNLPGIKEYLETEEGRVGFVPESFFPWNK